MKWLLLHVSQLSAKRRELFATFFLNMAVAGFAVAAFEGKWWGVIAGAIFFVCAFYLTKEL